MNTTTTSSLTFLLLVLFSCSPAAYGDGRRLFLDCLSQKLHNYSSISNNIVFTRNNPSYTSILQFSIRNPRFASESNHKPFAIITPQHESQIPPVIYCAKSSDIEIRTRSGGHDFEGLSYVAQLPFVIVDLINLSEITVDVKKKTAWVGAGATIGALYYRIAEKSPVLGFPAGFCPTVGAGGHFSGGGWGLMMRKYGLAADNVVDARIADVSGRILDRMSMGEDLFWAIRGGGGASFGVITAWKVQLVDVPETVTVFTVSRTLEQNANQLIHRWQYVAPNIHKDLFLGITISRVNSNASGHGGRIMTINASFFSQFLGGASRLLALMQEHFPELGLKREDCIEMSWIQSVLYADGIPTESPPQILLNRTQPNIAFFKGKPDYVENLISEKEFEGVWQYFYEDEGASAFVLMVPYGGRMAEIPDSAIPYPHRKGNLYTFGSLVVWQEEEDSERYIGWIRRLFDHMTPYASKNPRGAYVNYRDLDIGVNNVDGKTSYAKASVWGKKYFKDNFDRLVRVKTMVDADDFFRNEQSIPPIISKKA
ncbi:berberine bridge enzyme-like 28 [Salvia hispanica]|uniref:berberine bridge enzyme-like 28 n=1 Tax=Salvia hispanica TaxID=49212 RepID=UPI0020098BA1|nr:berberine bridge enzyme-like 28 [Salvia hispanica]